MSLVSKLPSSKSSRSFQTRSILKTARETSSSLSCLVSKLPSSNSSRSFQPRSILKTANETSSSLSQVKKNVKFHVVNIWEFPLVMGDNPACSAGVPITLAQEPISEMTVDVDMYEAIRKTKRRKGKRVMSVEERATIVLGAGYTLEEMARCVMKMNDIQRERIRSIQNAGWDQFSSNLVHITGRTLFFPKDIVVGVVGTTGTVMKGVVGSTGGVLKRMVTGGKNQRQKSLNAPTA